jgi:hypothetical protein
MSIVCYFWSHSNAKRATVNKETCAPWYKATRMHLLKLDFKDLGQITVKNLKYSRYFVYSNTYSITGTIRLGSPAYCWARKQDLSALVRHKLFESNQLPIAFTSMSMAEFHWPEAHRILHQALTRRGKLEDAAVAYPLSQGRPVNPAHSSKLHAILQRNTATLNYVSHLKVKAAKLIFTN